MLKSILSPLGLDLRHFTLKKGKYTMSKIQIKYSAPQSPTEDYKYITFFVGVPNPFSDECTILGRQFKEDIDTFCDEFERQISRCLETNAIHVTHKINPSVPLEISATVDISEEEYNQYKEFMDSIMAGGIQILSEIVEEIINCNI